MSNHELTQQSGEMPLSAMTQEDTQRMMMEMARAMGQMSNMMSAINDSMQRINHRIDLMDRLTPGQAKALGEAIKQRANALAEEYATGSQSISGIQSAIRKELRNSAGVEGKSLRDLPKCEYQVMLQRVALWEDYDVMTGIQRRIR